MTFRKLAILAGVAAVVSHAFTVWMLPSIAMNEAFKIITGDGELVNGMFASPRQTPETRDIGNPAPEIAYSSCGYDLSDGPVRVDIPGGDNYYSVAFYDWRAQNFRTLNDRDLNGQDATILLTSDQDAADDDADWQTVASPSGRGVIIIRRLVATPDLWPAITEIRTRETCAPADIKTGKSAS